jgi:hypothetical protein
MADVRVDGGEEWWEMMLKSGPVSLMQLCIVLVCLTNKVTQLLQTIIGSVEVVLVLGIREMVMLLNCLLVVLIDAVEGVLGM